jgi:hypothetical protein
LDSKIYCKKGKKTIDLDEADSFNFFKNYPSEKLVTSIEPVSEEIKTNSETNLKDKIIKTATTMTQTEAPSNQIKEDEELPKDSKTRENILKSSFQADTSEQLEDLREKQRELVQFRSKLLNTTNKDLNNNDQSDTLLFSEEQKTVQKNDNTLTNDQSCTTTIEKYLTSDNSLQQININPKSDTAPPPQKHLQNYIKNLESKLINLRNEMKDTSLKIPSSSPQKLNLNENQHQIIAQKFNIYSNKNSENLTSSLTKFVTEATPIEERREKSSYINVNNDDSTTQVFSKMTFNKNERSGENNFETKETTLSSNFTPIDKLIEGLTSLNRTIEDNRTLKKAVYKSSNKNYNKTTPMNNDTNPNKVNYQVINPKPIRFCTSSSSSISSSSSSSSSTTTTTIDNDANHNTNLLVIKEAAAIVNNKNNSKDIHYNNIKNSSTIWKVPSPPQFKHSTGRLDDNNDRTNEMNKYDWGLNSNNMLLSFSPIKKFNSFYDSIGDQKNNIFLANSNEQKEK